MCSCRQNRSEDPQLADSLPTSAPPHHTRNYCPMFLAALTLGVGGTRAILYWLLRSGPQAASNSIFFDLSHLLNKFLFNMFEVGCCQAVVVTRTGQLVLERAGTHS